MIFLIFSLFTPFLVLAIYLLFKVPYFKNKIGFKKITLFTSLLFLVSILILFICLKYSTLPYTPYIYLIGSFILMSLLYYVIFIPLTLLIKIFFKKNKIRNILFYILLFLPIVFTSLGYLELNLTQKITTLNIQTDNINLQNQKYIFFADPQFSITTQSKHAKRITKILQELKPSKIFIAGDIFNGENLNWSKIIPEMKKWSVVAPVYVVLGNHEFYGDYNEFLKILKEAKFTLVNNETIQSAGVNIYGLTYPNNQGERNNYYATMLKDLAKYKEDIIFMHEPPYDIAEEIVKYNPTLVFAGHTHNGQFWPLNYLVKLKYGKFIYGRNILEKTTFYTTSGFGISLIPNRLFNTPEIVVVNFTY